MSCLHFLQTTLILAALRAAAMESLAKEHTPAKPAAVPVKVAERHQRWTPPRSRVIAISLMLAVKVATALVSQ